MNTKISKTKLILSSLIMGIFLLGGTTKALAYDKINPVNLHLFYSNTCPHCEKEIEYLNKLEKTPKYKNLINVNKYEISTNRYNVELFIKVGKKLGVNVGSVPFLVIGDQHILGFAETPAFEEKITALIDNQMEIKTPDVVGNIINPTDTSEETETPVTTNDDTDHNTELKIPFIGNIKTENLSLPVLTFLIALLDGFNPCAMWVLVFLISLLLGMKDRKKMWVLGTTFIVSSALVYFLFLTAWLNFFIFIGYAAFFRVLIGLLALGIGGYYLYDAWKNRDGGCHIMANEKRQKTFKRLKAITQNQSLLLAAGGMVLMAFAVNMVELLCSAGLPAVYTKILAMHNLNTTAYYLYLLFYILVFMLDDLVVFIIAMVTLKAVGIESKYSRYSHIIGGIVMLVIGIMMVLGL